MRKTAHGLITAAFVCAAAAAQAASGTSGAQRIDPLKNDPRNVACGKETGVSYDFESERWVGPAPALGKFEECRRRAGARG